MFYPHTRNAGHDQ